MAKIEDKMLRIYLEDFRRLRQVKEDLIVENRRAVSDAETFEYIMRFYLDAQSKKDNGDSGFDLTNFK